MKIIYRIFSQRFFFMLLLLINAACSIFSTRRTLTTFVSSHKDTVVKNKVDCMVRCEEIRTSICIGVVHLSTSCFLITAVLNPTTVNEEATDTSLTTLYMPKTPITICPKSNWTYLAPNKMLSVYFLEDKYEDCGLKYGRPAVIISEEELQVVTRIFEEVGMPLVTGATVVGKRFRWYRGKEDMVETVWKNSEIPKVNNKFVGAIVDDRGISSFQPTSGHSVVLCECYEMVEY